MLINIGKTTTVEEAEPNYDSYIEHRQQITEPKIVIYCNTYPRPLYERYEGFFRQREKNKTHREKQKIHT